MKTMVLNAPGDMKVIDQEIDQSFSKMGLLRVISSGICAADSYLWSGNHPWEIKYPIVPGHEIFGEVIEIDKKLSTKFPLGTKVTAQVNVACYECELCLAKKFNMCTKKRHFGSTYMGSFAEQIALPFGSRLHAYTDFIDDQIGGLSETMANAIYCVDKVGLDGSETILILGMGSIGACLTHYLDATFQNLDLTVLTSSIEKRELLESRGIKAISLLELESKKDCFDVIFETSGFQDNFRFGLGSLKPTGKAMIYGVFQEKMLFDFNIVSEFKELTLVGGHLANDEAFEKSTKFLTKHQEDLNYLISNVVGFSNFTSAFTSPNFSKFKTIFQPNFESEFSNGF